jgi:NADPH:quinone reductase-like Zn-dependent oxidoreductase
MNTTETLPPAMRALELRAYDGAPSSLRLTEKPVPRPERGQVVVRIAASPVNPSDLLFLRGLYGIKKPLPVVPGFEASGVVVAAGPGLAARALLGRRVACAATSDDDGTWAEYMRTSVSLCLPLLPGVDLHAASAFANPLTVHALLSLAKGHKAAIQSAAASALGRMLVRVARKRRLPMVHVVRRPEQVELLRSMGATEVLDSSDPEFDARLKQTAKRLGATIAFDAVAGELSGRVLHAMPRGSRLVVYGALSEKACAIPPGDFIFRDKTIEGFWLSTWLRKNPVYDTLRAGVAVQRGLSDEFRTEVRARLPLEAAGEGLAEYASSMTTGKILFIPGHAPR